MRQLAKKWQPHHKALIIYALISVFYYLFFAKAHVFEWSIVAHRLFLIGYLLVWPYHDRIKLKWAHIADIFAALAFLGVFYGETATINQFNYLWDTELVGAEQWLFGTQPSLLFASHLPQIMVVEAMNLGYLSYYFMMMALPLYVVINNKPAYNKLFFTMITSFLMYYLFFCLFKSVGPQYYFPSPQNQAPDGPFFTKAIKWIQEMGEVPTGAFPSSHVGMALVFLYLAYHNSKHLFLIFIPFVVLLIASTVYIKAHYVVDVIGGVLSVPIVLFLSHKMWYLINYKSRNYRP
jgi:membrane-associated phospholipid phosphatase